MNEYIKVIQSNKDLSIDEMQAAINKIMSGKAGNSEIEQFLLELNKKGISDVLSESKKKGNILV